jgi:hypothetical protein
MTLLTQIQTVLEKTYRPSGVSLERCLVGPERSRELNQRLPGRDRELSPRARTYLRWQDGSLYLALYYHPDLIAHLEDCNPGEIISHHNIRELIAFIEEITHGVHASLAFHSGWKAWDSEQFACNLELQARVDTYWVLLVLARALRREPLNSDTRHWIKGCLFVDEQCSYHDRTLQRRYHWAREGSLRFIELCESEDVLQRRKWIGEFRELSLSGKLRFLRQHTGSVISMLS